MKVRRRRHVPWGRALVALGQGLPEDSHCSRPLTGRTPLGAGAGLGLWKCDL